MAKDGTMRGGPRPGQGRPKKALAEKIASGNPGGRPLTKLEIPDMSDELPDFEGADMPAPSEYLSALQKDGKPLGAAEIYKKTCRWLAGLGCERLVNPQLVEQYSMSVARWQQCEEAITKYGLVGRHPTVPTSPVQSPFVAMSHSYQKQASQLWYQIYQIVKENCTVDVKGPNPMEDTMERLLRSRNN